jgi:hypothetical protein
MNDPITDIGRQQEAHLTERATSRIEQERGHGYQVPGNNALWQEVDLSHQR